MNLFLKLLGNGILVQSLTIVSTLIFSRVFSVDQFGELAFYVSFGSLLAVIGGLRFDYLILRDSILDKEVGLFLSNIISIIINLIIFLFAFILQSQFGIIANINIFFLPLFGLGFSFFNNISQYLISKKEYSLFTKLRLVQVVGVFFIALLIKSASNNHYSMVYGYSLAQFVLGILGMFFILRKACRPTTMQLISFFKKHYHESFKNFLISFMQYSTPLMPVLIGGYIFDQRNIGAYFIFAQMISAPLNILRRNILVFFNGEFSSKEIFNSVINAKVLKLKNLLLFIALLIVISIFIYFFQQLLVLIILGSQWTAYSYLLLPLFIYFFLDCLLQPFTTLLPLWGKVNLSLGIELLRFILLIVILPICTLIFKIGFFNFLLIYIALMLFVYFITVLKVLHLSKTQEGCV